MSAELEKAPRFVARRASECPPAATVIPFIGEEDAKDVADQMNAGSAFHVEHAWCRGEAAKYDQRDDVDDPYDSWVVFDTAQEVPS